VTFRPSAINARSASLTITDNHNGVVGSTQTVTLGGSGIAPIAGVSPTTLAFGSQYVNTASAARTVTLSNTGSGPLTIASIAFRGTNPTHYSQTNTCGTSVAAGGNCTISVTFKPTAFGARPASLIVTDNHNGVVGSTQTVSLTGSGTAPVAAVSPTTQAFGNQNVNTTSAARTVTLSNTGTAPLTIASIAIGGTNPGDYAQTNTCAATVAAGANCVISVRFTPTAAGARSASLVVTDDSNGTAGSTQTVALTGAGVIPPIATVSPTSLDFGTQWNNQTSAAQTVTLTNTGTAVLQITGVAISGPRASDYLLTNNCGTSLAVGASCTCSVRFRPTFTGLKTATLTFTDNNGGPSSTQTVALTGSGY
jgi:hypothetical protein